MIATSIAGSIAHVLAHKTVSLPWTIGHVDLALAPLVFLGSQIGAPIGVRIERRLTLPRRRVIMGALLIVISVRLVYQAIS
jgi:uncharacterized membrane protein YfcA